METKGSKSQKHLSPVKNTKNLMLPHVARIPSHVGSHKQINFHAERQKYIFLKYGQKWKNAFDIAHEK